MWTGHAHTLGRPTSSVSDPPGSSKCLAQAPSLFRRLGSVTFTVPAVQNWLRGPKMRAGIFSDPFAKLLVELFQQAAGCLGRREGLAWPGHSTAPKPRLSLRCAQAGMDNTRRTLIWAQPDTSQIHRSSHGEQLISRDCNERVKLFPLLTPISSTERV